MKKLMIFLVGVSTFLVLKGMNNPPPPPPVQQNIYDVFDDILRRGNNPEISQRQREVIRQAYEQRRAQAQTEAERVELLRQETAEVMGSYANGAAIYQAGSARFWTDALFSKRAVGVAAGAFVAWHASSFIRDALDHYYRVPSLAQETSISSWKDTLEGFFFDRTKFEPVDLSEVILSPEMKQRVYELAEGIKQTAANNGHLRHVLFYGPSGVGKTMLARGLAQYAGCEFLYFSAAKLEMYTLEEGIKQIARLFEYPYSQKLMLIMDEAEVLFGKRDAMSDKTARLLSEILTYMGTLSPYFMVVGITNKPQWLDTASLSRFGEQIEMCLPSRAERKLLIELYIKKYLSDIQAPTDSPSLPQLLFFVKPAQPKNLIIAPDVLSDKVIDYISECSEGWSGRDISDLIFAVKMKAYATKEVTVTGNMVREALAGKLLQKKRQAENFAPPAA